MILYCIVLLFFQGTDFNAVHFNAVCMECDEHDEEKNARKIDILSSNGFTCQNVGVNCMCKNNNFEGNAKP
jgi:hypothetical protein